MGKQCGGHVCGCGCFILGSFFFSVPIWRHVDMHKHVITQQLYNLSPYPTCHGFSTIHHTHPYTHWLVSRDSSSLWTSDWPREHATWSAPSGGAFLKSDPTMRSSQNVGHPEGWWWSHRVADHESYQHWYWYQKQPWVVANICRCVVPEVLGATFGITPAGTGEMGLLVEATASGCTGPPRRGPAALLYLGC